MHGTRVNWVGMTGAVVLFGYGWWREPLAAVLGGMILLVNQLEEGTVPDKMLLIPRVR